jgi:2-polyprenyl-3-methyl-5-hydroxy-6-metoxy-1,4-benzoquinol methylase
LNNNFSLYREYLVNQIKREQSNPLPYSRIYYWWRKTKIITLWLERVINEKGDNIHLYDIGCGDAMRLASILSHLKITDIVNYSGFDLNQKQLQIARLRFEICKIPHFIFEKADITEDIPRDDNSANIIISCEVLEHLQKPECLLKEAFRLLKHGGIAIFTTPNERTIFGKYNKAPQRQSMIDTESDIETEEEGFGHISVKPLRKWLDLSKKEGFVILEAKYGSFLFGTHRLDNSPILFAISLFIEKILRFFPKRLQTGEDALFILQKP